MSNAARRDASPAECKRISETRHERPAADEPLADQVRRFCEELEQDAGWQDWQVRQAEHALRIYFVNFLQRTDWHRQPQSTVVDEHGRTAPLPALEEMRSRLRTRPTPTS